VLSLLSEVSLSSLMAPNVVRAEPIIKHVFEACRRNVEGRHRSRIVLPHRECA
jgi:hypothetical protein